MNQLDLIYEVQKHFEDGTMARMADRIAEDCLYYSRGELRESGREQVIRRLETVAAYRREQSIPSWSWVAEVTESEEPDVSVGETVLAEAMYDEYYCTGFLRVQDNGQGLIQKMSFSVSPKVKFRLENGPEWGISCMYATAREAVRYRGIAFGILDGNEVLDRHVQRYEELIRMNRVLLGYINRNLFDGFNQGIENAAGYLFCSGMSETVRRRTGKGLFGFHSADSVLDRTPGTEERFREWTETGYALGKKLFLGFMEFVNQRRPSYDVFNEQLKESFLEVSMLGSVFANKDMDRNVPCTFPNEDLGPGDGDYSACDLTELTRMICSDVYDRERMDARMKEILKKSIEEGVWFYTLGDTRDGGCRMKILGFQKKAYYALFTGESEIRNPDGDTVFAIDIRRYLSTLFASDKLEGFILNPYTWPVVLKRDFFEQISLSKN